MSKLGIVITDGVGFRNFILSDFLKEAQSEYEEVIIYSCLPASVYASFDLKAKVIELPVFQENFSSWFFMKAKEVAHLYLNKKGNFGIQDSFRINKAPSSSIRGYAKRFIFFVTRFLHSEKWVLRFENMQRWVFKNHKITKGYIQQLKADGVDFLFFTHQRPPYIAPLIYAADKNGINTGTFIFSWDNLASKGRMAGTFGTYFVWSDLMKTELLEFYRSVEQDDIFVVGTPQFEPYVLKRYAIDKQEFFKRFALNPEQPTICFSCGDIATSKNDELYIETIARAMLDGKLIHSVNLLVRTSPAESPERFKTLADQYDWIHWNFPKWELSRSDHQESWSQRVPLAEDVIDLRAILEHSDLFINMCSTMSLDAMCFDKPVINPVFGNADNELYDDQRFLKYAHYKRVVESGAVAISKDPEQLINHINEALKNPGLRLEEQSKLINIQISGDLEGTSKRLVAALKKANERT